MMGHLNSFSASGGGNLNKNFPKIQMPGGLPGGVMLKLRFDWYITDFLRLQNDANIVNSFSGFLIGYLKKSVESHRLKSCSLTAES